MLPATEQGKEQSRNSQASNESAEVGEDRDMDGLENWRDVDSDGDSVSDNVMKVMATVPRHPRLP